MIAPDEINETLIAVFERVGPGRDEPRLTPVVTRRRVSAGDQPLDGDRYTHRARTTGCRANPVRFALGPAVDRREREVASVAVAGVATTPIRKSRSISCTRRCG